MRIALDTNGLFTTQAGVARYIRGLLKGFERAAVPQLNLSTLAWEVENYGYRQPQRALRTAYRDLIWSSFVAPARLRAAQADLLHSTVTCLVRVPTSVRHVVTVHDLAADRDNASDGAADPHGPPPPIGPPRSRAEAGTHP